MTALYMDSFDHYGGASLDQRTDPYGVPAFNNMMNAGWIFTDPGFGSATWGIVTPLWGPARTGPRCLARANSGALNQTGVVDLYQLHPLISFYLSV